MGVRYSEKTEMLMQVYYGRLSERDRRRYAAIEAEKLGYGGVSYISRLLGVNRKTILTGQRELLELSGNKEKEEVSVRQRKVGGGRKKNGSRI